jgi:hypothetical protein
MKKMLLVSALALALAAFGNSASAAPSRGTACVDVAVTATCSKNVVTATASIANCGSGADTILLTETLTDPDGVVDSNESASIYLKGGKSTSLTVNQAVPSNVVPGVYTLYVTAAAKNGSGKDAASTTMYLPCP